MKKHLLLIPLIFFINCNIINYKEHRNFYIEALNNELEKLARTNGLVTLNTFSIFLNSNNQPDPKYYNDDGIHLTTLGYQSWINNILLPFLSKNDFKSIAMVGNSITAGVNGADLGNNDGTISNWEYALHIKAYNLGVGGNTSCDVVNRLENIASYQADCYLLEIGINDICKRIPLWEILDNIEIIINHLKKNATVVIQYVMPTCPK